MKCTTAIPGKIIIFTFLNQDYETGVYYFGIKVFNNLPSYIKNMLYSKKDLEQP
jgi:hypothetical protein